MAAAARRAFSPQNTILVRSRDKGVVSWISYFDVEHSGSKENHKKLFLTSFVGHRNGHSLVMPINVASDPVSACRVRKHGVPYLPARVVLADSARRQTQVARQMTNKLHSNIYVGQPHKSVRYV